MYRTEIQPNAPVIAADGEAGQVTHIIVDPRTNHVSELVVGRAGREWLVPAGFVESTAGGAVRLRGASDALLTVPFDLEEFRATNRRPAPAERAEARTDAVSTGPAAAEAAAERSTPPARRTGYPLVDLVRRQQAFTTDADGVIRIPLRRRRLRSRSGGTWSRKLTSHATRCGTPSGSPKPFGTRMRWSRRRARFATVGFQANIRTRSGELRLAHNFVRIEDGPIGLQDDPPRARLDLSCSRRC